MPKKKQKAAIYARISSAANKDGAGLGRQKAACRKTGADLKLDIVHSVAEVVSGSLPLEQRACFKELLEKCRHEGIQRILVEGSRAVARSAVSAEEVYQQSKQAGIEITPCDIPSLYTLDANPAQKFLRRVIFAYTELEKDMTVSRLQDGLKSKLKAAKGLAKKGRTVKRNQSGKIKVNGRRSTMERLGLNMDMAKKKLGPSAREYSQCKISCRELARKFSRALRLKKIMGHETARRIHFQLYG